MTRLLSLAALVALSTSTCMHTAASQPILECRIEPRAPLTAGGPAEIRFVLTNPSRQPVWFLSWNTPFEGWMGSIFTVTGPDGTELPYTGPLVKRGDPSRDEYVQIPPGGEVDAAVDLANVYDLREPGSYRLRVTDGLVDLTAEPSTVPRLREQHQRVELRCGEVTLEARPQE
jgi:peptidyl-Lys metalloendopeptidase